MNYKEFLSNYAKKNGFKITDIDEDTFKMNSRDRLLKIYFRDHNISLEAWGSFIDFHKRFSFEELETLLDTELKSKKLIFGLDENLLVSQEDEQEINKEITKEYFTNGTKYCLECDFFNPSKLYEYTNKVQEIPMFERCDILSKIEEKFKEQNIEYKTFPNYFEILDNFDRIVLKKDQLEFRIFQNINGSKLVIFKEHYLDSSQDRRFEIDLTKQKLEDIDFLSYF